MNFEKINILINKIDDNLNQMTYYIEEFDQKTHEHDIKLKQSGVCRVNCIDCCDRTNVVQTYISRKILTEQLQKLELLKTDEKISDNKKFQSLFSHVWANNGDVISELYAGTTALMSDYTRSGERTISGLLNDGYNSAKRYLKNNFADTIRQRSIELSLGLLDLNSKEEIEASQNSNEIISTGVSLFY
jgi:phosphatidylinositol 4-phosphatase